METMMYAFRRAAAILIIGSVSGVVATAAGAAESATAILDLARGGDVQAVRTLLQQHAADVNAPGPDGATALHVAVQRGDVPMTTALIAAGANVRAANRYGVQPLAIAAVDGNAELMRLLLDAGADPNSGLSAGETPLMT